MTKRLTKQQRAKVQSIVDGAMNAPADDELVAIVFSAYKAGVDADELTRDPLFEQKVVRHLKGGKYQLDFRL